MRKKGYTLIEMVVVLAIICILLSVVYMNMIRVISQSKVQSFTNQTVAIIKESYENSNKEMDFSSWKIEIDNHSKDTNKLTIRLKKGDSIVNEIESEKIQFKNSQTSDFSAGIYYIMFKNTGEVKVYENDLRTERGEYNNFLVEISNIDNPNYKKTIEIKSIPPGSISVK